MQLAEPETQFYWEDGQRRPLPRTPVRSDWNPPVDYFDTTNHPVFAERVKQAMQELENGDSRGEVRERHGIIVVRTALEWMERKAGKCPRN